VELTGKQQGFKAFYLSILRRVPILKRFLSPGIRCNVEWVVQVEPRLFAIKYPVGCRVANLQPIFVVGVNRDSTRIRTKMGHLLAPFGDGVVGPPESFR